MRLEDVKQRLIGLLKDHYAFEEFEFNDAFGGAVLKELDVDSIALLELFLVIEEGFHLNQRLSDRLDMKSLMDSKVDDLVDTISMEILKMWNENLK
jgi:acyl carrier protein